MKAKEQLHTSPDSWDKVLPTRLHIMAASARAPQGVPVWLDGGVPRHEKVSSSSWGGWSCCGLPRHNAQALWAA